MSPKPTTTFVYSEQVLPGAAQEAAEPALIGMEGPVIVSVERMPRSALAKKRLSDGARVVDLGSDLVTPTFVNAHTHLAMSAFRGLNPEAFGGNIVEDFFYTLETAMTAEDVKAFARYAAYECILSGTGLVWDHYYHGVALAEGLAEAGLPAVVAPTLQDVAGPGVPQLEAQLSATCALDADGWRGRGIFTALGPHATDTVSEGLWRTIINLASQRRLPLHMHVAQSPEEFTRALSGSGHTPIALLAERGVLDTPVSKLLVHGLYTSARDLEHLKGKDVTLGYCPFSQALFGFPARASAWKNAGLSVAIGTDAGAGNDSMDVQQELRLAAGGRAFGVTRSATMDTFFKTPSSEAALAVEDLRLQERHSHRDMASPETLLNAVWCAPGELHPHFKCGSIRAGYLANLAIWDRDHPALWPIHNVRRSLAMNSTAPALKGLFLLGKQRGRIGDFQRSIAEEPGFRASRDEAEARRIAFLKRVGLH